MTLNEIRTLVDNSKRADWHKHSEAAAVHSLDIDVSLDWSETINSNFTESWHQELPAPGASSISVVLQHNGCPVSSWPFVAVDGGRYLVPLPRPSAAGVGYEVSSEMMPLGNLMFDLFHPGGACKTLADLLSKCNVTVV